MPTKIKFRLYLGLNHRLDKPGYHWSILFAPKDQKVDTDEEPNTIRWDATDISSASPLGVWTFREEKLNQLRSASLIARILLGKFEADSIVATEARLRSIFSSVPVLQEEGFTCRVWALNAIEALANSGMVVLKLDVRHREGREEFEDVSKSFADEIMEKIKKGQSSIKNSSDIPVLDVRKKVGQ